MTTDKVVNLKEETSTPTECNLKDGTTILYQKWVEQNRSKLNGILGKIQLNMNAIPPINK